jgi:AAA+ superfamily predicted ATPase
MQLALVPADLARTYLSRHLALHAERRRANGSAFGPSSEEIAIALRAGPVETHAEVSALAAAEHARVIAAETAFAAAIEAEPSAALARLSAAFALSPVDLRIVAVLLAPELDHDLERAYTYAIDDFTRKRPDVGFVARLIGGPDPQRLDQVLVRLGDDAPLRRHGVVALGAGGDLPTTMRPVRLADRVVAFCRGHDTVDELVRGFAWTSTREPSRHELVLAPELIARIAHSFDGRLGAPRILLVGPEGVGRALVVEALHAETGTPVVRIDLAGIVADGGKVTERLAAGLREAALRTGVAFLDGGAAIDRDAPRGLVQAIAELARGLDVPLVFSLATHPGWLVDAVPSLIEIDVPAPTFSQRRVLWRRALPSGVADDEAIDIVASRYAFTGGTITRAAHRALQAARLRDPEAPRVGLDDLGDAARLTFSHRLGAMAQRIPTGFTWDDLVLSVDTLDAVREVVRFARHRPFLLEEWGFAAKLPYGRGVSAILAGPPGTGKTMVAQLLARELGYDLYRIDLSQVVNKYIGETEKNLAKIFDEAETSHAVLFFDEADALFAKRTEVRSSNDRYANLEVNYLLQRMETFDGVTLLATNLEQGIDDAFKRRVRFTIQFELPEPPERARLWRSMFPPEVPLAAGIDWELLARRFVMAGGYIKKAAVRAALRAAESRRAITTEDLLEAANHEYREMGRVV